MLNIFRTNTYKSGCEYILKCLSAVDQRQLDTRHIVVVPERSSLEAERQMLSAVGGSFNIAIMTFSRLASSILPKYSYMSKQAGIMAITAIIQQISDQLVCYVKGNKSVGFAESVYQTICQLKYNKISPQQLQNTTFPHSLAGKMQDIALIYSNYQQLLQGAYLDSADKLDMLVDSINQSDWCHNCHFYLYDFDNITNQQLNILTALIHNSAGVTVSCCVSDQGRDKYIYVNDIYDNLITRAKQENIQPNIIQDIAHTNKYCKQIGKGLFHYDQVEPIENNGFVEVFEGTNRVQEVYNLACKISQYIRQGGRYRDIFVATSDINSYSNAIATVFDQFDIPYFCDRQFCLAHHQYVQFLIDFLNMSNNASQGNMLSVAKNALLPLQEHIFDFENYVYKYNISYRLDKFALGKKDATYANADKVREYLYHLTSNCPFPKQATARQYVELIRQLIATANLDVLVEDFATKQQDSNLVQYSKFSRQVAGKVNEILSQLETILDHMPLSLEQLGKIILVACQSETVSVLPTRSDCVVLANMAKARKHDIKMLALLGCNSGCIPLVAKDTQLLTDDNLAQLANCGIVLDPSIKLANKRERFSLYQLLQEPSHNLLVSYTLSSGNDSLIPANWVDRLYQLFNDKGVPISKISHSDNNVYSTKQALSKIVSNTQRLADNQVVNMPHFAVLKEYLAPQLEQYSKLKQASNMAVANGDQLLIDNMSTSISKICQYYKCPYGYYFRYGLHVKPRQEARLEANVMGDILHATLEKYVRHLDKTESDDQTKKRATKIFAEVMDDDFYRALYTDVATARILKQLQKEAVKLCTVIKCQLRDTDFVNHSCELQFGGKGEDIPAVVVNYQGGQFQLRGKIDRIDIWQDKFIVIDYKSGSDTNYTEKLLYIGHKLQLLVYLKAIVQHLNIQPVGYYYFQLHNKFSKQGAGDNYGYSGRTLNDLDTVKAIDNTIKQGKSKRLSLRLKKDGMLPSSTSLISASQIDSQIDYALSLIARAGQLMNSGFVGMTPYEGSCGYCDYADICDYNDIFAHDARKVTSKITADTIDSICCRPSDVSKGGDCD